MRTRIPQLANHIQQQAGVEQDRIRWLGSRGAGSIDPRGDVYAPDEPIVRTVLEDVSQWHRRCGELVYEHRLYLSLDEV